jgi:PST family polysaccharide transporter
MNNLISHIKDARFLFYNSAFEKIAYFILFLFFARIFSAAQYGEFITINNLGNILISICSLGIGIQLQSKIAKNISSSREIFSNYFILTLIILISDFAAGMILYYGFYSHLSPALFVVIILWSGISAGGSNLSFAYYGINRYNTPFYINFSVKLITFTVAVIAGFTFHNFIFCIFILLAGVIIYFILTLRYFPYSIELSSVNKKYLKNILLSGLPLGIATVFNFLYDKIDIIVLSFYTDFTLIAFYGIAYGLYKSSSLSFSFIIQKTLTSFSEISEDKNKLELSLLKYANLIALICIVVSILLYLFSGLIVHIIYSDVYIQAAGILKILAFGILPMGLNNLTGTFINSLGFYKVNMVITIIAFILNVTLNIFLIPIYSVKAAALISVFTEILILILELIFIIRFFAKK